MCKILLSIIFSFLGFFCFFSESEGYVSIDVGQARIRESQVAIQPFIIKGSAGQTARQAGEVMFKALEQNFLSSGYFKLIDQEAFLETPGEKSFLPYPKDSNGFRWENWRLLNTDYLILGGYSVQNNLITLDIYLYHVPLRRRVFQKQYKGGLNLSEKIAHKASNDIVAKLTGKPGIFLTKLAVSRSTKGSKKELFMMDWNGNNIQQISFHRSIALAPAWSKDGNLLAYMAFLYRNSSKSRNGSLILYNRLNQTRQVISNRRGVHLGSDFLPDGKHILLSLFLGRANMDIARLSLKTGKLKPLTFGPSGTINVEPVAHPRGKNILFSSDRGGKIMIYSMNMNGRNIRPLTWRGSYNSTPQYSPDGQQVVFSGFSNGRFDIFIMNPDGSDLKRLTSFKKQNGRWANHESPSFSPDGRHIVFTSNRLSDFSQLYIMNIVNETVKRITFDSHNYKTPKWSPFLK